MNVRDTNCLLMIKKVYSMALREKTKKIIKGKTGIIQNLPNNPDLTMKIIPTTLEERLKNRDLRLEQKRKFEEKLKER